LHFASTPVAIVGAVLCFGLRLIALRRRWHLPVADLYVKTPSEKGAPDDGRAR